MIESTYGTDDLRRLCERFRDRPAGVRNALTTDDLYVLLAFAGQAAVAAMRSGDAVAIADGLTAVAMIDDERVDPRDLAPVLGLLRHAATFIGADAGALFAEGARQATRSVARAFQRQPMPASPELLRVALEIDALLERDGYRVEEAKLAATLPEAWLDTRAASVVTMHMRSGERMLIAYVAELDAADSVRPIEHDTASLLVAHERFLCLLIARGETTASLQRFLEPVSAAARRRGTAAPSPPSE
ncbi:MAG TPA: hypothetical protein VJZ76_15840 [Thermoanaerobaculia bacterium]|nr:hypothetical protein [Thermoanaerobaculia bacterium]